MIITALATYYDRAVLAGEDLPPMGLEKRRIPFLVEITGDGAFYGIRDTRESGGEDRKGREFLVPKDVNKSGRPTEKASTANLLWDKLEYALDCSEGGGAPEYGGVCHRAFMARLDSLPSEIAKKANIAAVVKFLQNPDKLSAMRADPLWGELVGNKGHTVSFALKGEHEPICSDPAIRENLSHTGGIGEDGVQLCIASGKKDLLAIKHHPIKGVMGTGLKGAPLVSFNTASYCSYGKEQGANSPMSESMVFRYTTGLNYLLRKEKCLLAGSNVVFWARESNSIEQHMPTFFRGGVAVSDKAGGSDAAGEEDQFALTSPASKANPDAGANKMKALFEAVHKAPDVAGYDENDFYILGLYGAATGRIAVRFWHQTTVRDIADNIRRYFDNTAIVAPKDRNDKLSIYHILRGVAAEQDIKKLSPLLAGQWIKAIIAGHAYPRALLHAAVIRCRAEQDVRHERAAAIKACIVTSLNYSDNHKEKYTMLDPAFPKPGYVLGRLFAILERVQTSALGNINASIKDRYYGAASATPGTVFPLLLKTSNHHIGKLTDNQRGFYEKLKGEAMNLLDGQTAFPPTLSMEDQGRFALGYYHQRQYFYTSKQDKENTND